MLVNDCGMHEDVAELWDDSPDTMIPFVFTDRLIVSRLKRDINALWCEERQLRVMLLATDGGLVGEQKGRNEQE